jgi:hypothetical protein
MISCRPRLPTLDGNDANAVMKLMMAMNAMKKAN